MMMMLIHSFIHETNIEHPLGGEHCSRDGYRLNKTKPHPHGADILAGETTETNRCVGR